METPSDGTLALPSSQSEVLSPLLLFSPGGRAIATPSGARLWQEPVQRPPGWSFYDWGRVSS